METDFPARENRREQVPLDHYRGIYQNLDPRAIARRCALPFDGAAFTLRLMGTSYRGSHPDFEIREALPSPAADSTVGSTGGGSVDKGVDNAEKILILRYLCEGEYRGPGGKQLSYHDVPWGQVYYRNFEGRCIKPLARTFGVDPEGFTRIMESAPELRGAPLGRGDAGYRFEFMSGLYMGVILWAGDEEFPPSAQILFDDNLIFAFTAEDLAVAGEVMLRRLKKRGAALLTHI